MCVVNNGKIVSRGAPRDIKKDLIRRYIQVDAADREKLKKELTAKKLTFSKSAPYKITLGKQTAHQLIQSIKTPLTDIEVHTPTLEEAYLEIIGKQNGNGH